MSKKYTKDELISCFIETTKDTTKFMERVATALEAINDSNLLHKKAIDKNTQISQLSNQTSQEVVRSFSRIWYIFLLVIGSLIILAGAEKIFQFIKLQ